MQRHETFMGKIMKQGMRQQVHMKVYNVELSRSPSRLAQHGEGATQMVSNSGKS